MTITRLLKRLLPSRIWKVPSKLKLLLHRFEILNILPRYQKKALKKLKSKKRIKCVFLALFNNNWKYDKLYQIMLKDDRFEPVILVCPIVNYGRKNMISRMNDCFTYFKSKGYHPIKSYNEDTDTYIDLIRDLNPDIIFYTNPYKGLIDDRYYIDRFPQKLTIYVPYSMQEGKDDDAKYNQNFHNRLWRYYTISDLHKQYSQRLAMNKARNVFVTGYPGIEYLIDKGYKPSTDCWKIESAKLKKIIWAPHHTLESTGNINYSTFLQYCDFMLKMVEKYKDLVQWVFKPHPLLINKLYLLWGKEKTDEYYLKWVNGGNTNYVDGDYIDLFLTSDAILHDSGSFLAEYLYTGKPAMRPMKKGIKLEDTYSSFGLSCIDHYYKAYNAQDIENFIKMVIAGGDPMKEQRTKFVKEFLMPKQGMPSENILNDINDSIEHQRVFARSWQNQ